jgi:hypothetical protein
MTLYIAFEHYIHALNDKPTLGLVFNIGGLLELNQQHIFVTNTR